MGSILHRGAQQYRVQIRRKGVNLCRTFSTLEEAKLWESTTEAKLLGNQPIQKRPAATLAEACDWYEGQIGNHPNAKNERTHVRYWKASKFAHWSLSVIHDWDCIQWRREVLDEDAAEEDGIGPNALFGPQTAIHRLNILSKIIQTWGRAHKVALENPVKAGVRPSKPDGRDRRIHPDEETAILKAAEGSTRPWLRAAIIISLETAMRQGELAGLTWDRVYLDRRFVDLTKTKNDRARRVPLSRRAIEAFQSLQGNYKPVPIETPSGIIQAFRDINAFEDLRWHDLRHEAVSRLFEKTDLRDHEIMAISGHLTSAMLSRYTHLRADRLADRLG